MKQFKVEIPDGYEIDRKNSSLETIRFKKKSPYPTTWREFCERSKWTRKEWKIMASSEIQPQSFKSYRPKNPITEKNILPNKEYAEAVLALCQLIQLLDYYNEGWRPNWSDSNEKYCLTICEDGLQKPTVCWSRYIMAFKSKKARDAFAKNEEFVRLMKKAKPVLV